jgi:hypothetical protein
VKLTLPDKRKISAGDPSGLLIIGWRAAVADAAVAVFEFHTGFCFGKLFPMKAVARWLPTFSAACVSCVSHAISRRLISST